MGIPSMDDKAFIMAVFSSSSIDDSQVMRVGAVVHIECPVVGDSYGGFSHHLAGWFILEGDHWGTAVLDVGISWSLVTFG